MKWPLTLYMLLIFELLVVAKQKYLGHPCKWVNLCYKSFKSMIYSVSLWFLLFPFNDLDAAKQFKDNRQPISFTCDGDCKNDNVTIQIDDGRTIELWDRSYDYSYSRFALVSHFTHLYYDASIRISNNCGCKEEINYPGEPETTIPKCRVRECFFKDNDFKEDNDLNVPLSNNIFTFRSLTDDRFTTSVYLQGATSIFRGGKIFVF